MAEQIKSKKAGWARNILNDESSDESFSICCVKDKQDVLADSSIS